MERRVTTKEELKKAKENKVDVIIVEGKLAMDLIEARKITKLGKTALAIFTTGIAAGIATAPFYYNKNIFPLAYAYHYIISSITKINKTVKAKQIKLSTITRGCGFFRFAI